MADINNVDQFLINRIYDQMKQASTNVYYADELLDRQILTSKLFNVGVALLSTGGAALYFVESFIPLLTSIIVAFAAVVNQFYPVFFMKTEDIAKLVSLRTDYSIYLHRLQNLFNDAFYNRVTNSEASSIYDQLFEANATKESEMSRLFGRVNLKLNDIAAKKSDNYLNSIYNANE